MNPMMILQQLGQQAPSPPRPVIDAQRMELRARLAAYDAESPPHFKRGDFVREKQTFSLFNASHRKNVQLVFVRHTGDWDAEAIRVHLGRFGFITDLNCVLAYVDDDGTTAFIPHSTYRLELDPDQTCLGDGTK